MGFGNIIFVDLFKWFVVNVCFLYREYVGLMVVKV